MSQVFYTFTTIVDQNIAYHVTNDKKSVDDARLALSKKYNSNIKKLQYMDQIHSNKVCIADPLSNPKRCDGLITNIANTPLLVMVADCIPILFFDETKNVIGVAHAGRNGTYQNISQSTVLKMMQTYDCNPKDIKVILGPSIQKCCYEVSQELADIASKSFGKEYIKGRYLDLQGINVKQLKECGVLQENIEVSKVCTKCSNQPYYSYRNDKECGRFGGLIYLKS